MGGMSVFLTGITMFITILHVIVNLRTGPFLTGEGRWIRGNYGHRITLNTAIVNA
jgi:hypothetical protein